MGISYGNYKTIKKNDNMLIDIEKLIDFNTTNIVLLIIVDIENIQIYVAIIQ